MKREIKFRFFNGNKMEYPHHTELPNNYLVLMQATGFKDKTAWEELTQEEKQKWEQNGGGTEQNWDGKEIYEGDILKCNTDFRGDLTENLFGLVLWNDLDGRWDGFIDYNDSLGHFLKWSNCVVVGNTNENKELLNKKQLHEIEISK